MGLFSRNAELYDFARVAQHWRYTSASGTLSVSGADYQNAAIKRGRISEQADPSHNTLDITAPQDLPLLDEYRGNVPNQPINLVLYRQNVGNGSIATIWSGEIGSVEWGVSTAVIHCLPPLASLRALGLKRNWQRQCPHVLYGAEPGGCNASRAAVQVSATITQVTGNVIHAAEFASRPDGWWSGGYIEWPVASGTERRFIVDHTGDSVSLLTPAAPLAVGAVVTALPGCDHTLATCASKFTSSNPADVDGNSANYGGQPGIPVKDPFGSKPIY